MLRSDQSAGDQTGRSADAASMGARCVLANGGSAAAMGCRRRRNRHEIAIYSRAFGTFGRWLEEHGLAYREAAASGDGCVDPGFVVPYLHYRFEQVRGGAC